MTSALAPIGHSDVPPIPEGPVLRRMRWEVTMAMEAPRVFANIDKAHSRNLPSFWRLPEVMKFKGEEPIALVGGGPSLNKTIADLRQFRTVVACGSAHDHLIENGIVPRYCVVADPDAIAADYIKKPHPSCTYLVASQCDDAVFDALKNYPVAVWHSGGIGTPEEQEKLFRKENAIGGGSTVFLRSINIAIILGYGNQHYFGFDSCLDDGVHHAYVADDDVMKENLKRLIDVRVVGSDRIFFCLPYMAAQAEQFQGLLKRQGNLFTPTIHGDGLIAEIMRQGRRLQMEKENATLADVSLR